MSPTKSLSSHTAIAVALLCFVLLALAPVYAANDIVISQVYGGGGNSGATLKNDFIELFNRGTVPVDVTGWSIQYASSAGTSWTNKTVLSGVIQPGHYYLIQEAQGSGGTVSLPAPDATGTIAMSATAGKIALVNNSTTLSGACPTGAAIIDFVGFGTAATCFEGAGPTATLSNTTAALRAGSGCVDTDSNSADFSVGAPDPRNGASPVAACTLPTNPSITASTATPNNIEAGGKVLFLATVNPGANPVSTGVKVTADLSTLGGLAAQSFYDDGTNGDTVSGDNTFSFEFTTSTSLSAGSYTLPITVSDDQLRSSGVTVTVVVTSPPTPAAIHEIQGSGALSPLVGQRVAFTGIVTAVAYNGFYVEAPEEEQDSDPVTSEGIFVYSGSTPTVQVADSVKVSGTVSEYGSGMPVTEINTPSYTVLSSGNTVPAVVDISPDPAGPMDQLERYEGMLVRIASPTAVGPTGGSSTSDGIFYVTAGIVPRPFREPGLEPGIAPALQVPGAPRFDGNPERIRVDSASRNGTRAIVAAGDTVPDIVGPLGYSTDYTVYADPLFVATTTAHATPLPDRGDREFTVATFNMLNFTNNPNRIQKASMAIRDIMRLPDIIGVEEVNTQATLQALASRINQDVQANGGTNPGYTAQLLAPSGSQNVGLLYRTDRVTDVSVVQVGDDALMPNSTLPLNDRPPLVMAAKLLPPVGQPFPVTVIVNHLRSLIDVDADSSSGVFARTKRQLEAEYLASLIAQHQSAGEHVISVGDYNSYEFSDGLVDVLGTVKGVPTPEGQVLLASNDLVDPDLIDLGLTLPAALRYSYVENGNAQMLDHIVVTSDLLARPYHLEVAHNDADFPGVLANDATRPERVSDHDMPVAHFTFPPPAADLSLTLTGEAAVLSGSVQTYTIQVHNAGPDAAVNVTMIETLAAASRFRALSAPAGWTCTTPAVGASGTISCTASSLQSGADAQFTLDVLIDCATTNDVQVTNAAGVTSETSDPDSGNNSAVHETSVSNPPPQITGLAVSAPVLWAPNHKMVPVTLSYGLTDNCDTSLIPTVLIGSNQSVTEAGPHAADWDVVDATHVLLRAERVPPGDRVYTIALIATDSSGNSSTAYVQVVVPQSQGQ